MSYGNRTVRLIILLLWPFAAYAGTASERLDVFFNDVQVLQTDFQQTVLDDKGNKVKEAQGNLVMQRPGKFRWTYTDPYQQLIVADGDKIWIYDADLEQVTVKPMDAALGDTPAVLLAGGRPLDENFLITDMGSNGSLEWVELLPRNPDATFERVRLGFGEEDLRMMELLDNFGQTTRLEFSNLRRNQKADAQLFTFTPPPGVDVIGQEQ